jgi:hypothetical protein
MDAHEHLGMSYTLQAYMNPFIWQMGKKNNLKKNTNQHLYMCILQNVIAV